MEVKASAKYIRMSPRKVRLVADLVRGLPTGKAVDQLRFANKKAAEPLMKLINSAIANATHNFELEENNLYIKELRVNVGPTLDRWMPRARGRATPIRKRTSHIDVVVSEIVESGKKEAKKQKIEAPVKLGSKPKEDEGVKLKKESEDKSKEAKDEKWKKIRDPRGEGKGKHTAIEGGGSKGFVNKVFRRKSG